MMSRFKCLWLLGLLLVATQSFAAKENYHITVKIADGNDSMLLMGNYYAKGTYALDTAYRDKNGVYTFSSSEKELHPGLYFFATGTGKFVEFVVYREKPFFSFETKDDDWMRHMVVKGSAENECFFRFHRLRQEAAALLPPEPSRDSASYLDYRRLMERTMDSLRLDFIDKNPERMISRMMLATKEVPVPTKDPFGLPLDNQFRWKYYVTHYFDNMPLDDDFLVRTPQAVFYDRVMNYMDQALNGAPPEMITPYLDTLLNRAKPSKENFKWLLHTLTEHYLQSKIMVYDAVYVHLIQEFYAKGDAWWMTPTDLESEIDRAERWDKLLVGRIAPELFLYDTLHQGHSLHRQDHDFTLLIFWSPACGHCQATIPALYEKFQNYKKKYDIQGFAILTEFDDETVVKWKKFINEHHLDWINLNGAEANVDWHEVYDVTSTPQIYLLDRDKQILAKKLGADTFEQVMDAIIHEREAGQQ